MKWIFRSAVLILIAFAALWAFCYTLEDSIQVERYRTMPDLIQPDIFPYLEDLELMEEWSPWIDPAGSTQVLYENDPGEGQVARWKSKDFSPEFGEQRIFELENNNFVRTEIELDGLKAVVTYALDEAPDGSVGMLLGIDYETKPGGMPLKRLGYARMRKRIAKDFDAALARLYDVVMGEE